MSNGNSELEQVKKARASLQKFRLKLLRPSVATLESGAADLAVAIEYLERIEPASRIKRSPVLAQSLRLEVAGLRRELEQVNALLEGAGNFYQGWARLLGLGSEDEAANYRANGQPVACISSASKNVVVHG